jgi:hypothetical protein
MSQLNFICTGKIIHKGNFFTMEVGDEEKLPWTRRKGIPDRFQYVHCPLCGEAAKHIGAPCSGSLLTWELDMNNGDRRKYAKDMVQRFRDGELSKEFTKLYPKQTADMVRGGTITAEQVKKAKNVWTDMKGLD